MSKKKNPRAAETATGAGSDPTAKCDPAEANKSSNGPQYEFHPLANMFPLMTGCEFAGLVEDISKHGLHEPIWLYEEKILDGRNRYRACRDAGVDPEYRHFSGNHVEAFDFVYSANFHRRHLNGEDKRKAIEEFLKMHPEKSDRAVAGETETDHKTVAKVRAKKVATGEFPQLNKRVGKDGKERKAPVAKTPAAKTPRTPAEPAKQETPPTPAVFVLPVNFDDAVARLKELEQRVDPGFKIDGNPGIRCSFCMRFARDVRRMVTARNSYESRDVAICNECIALCVDTIREQEKGEENNSAPPAAEAAPLPPATAPGLTPGDPGEMPDFMRRDLKSQVH